MEFDAPRPSRSTDGGTSIRPDGVLPPMRPLHARRHRSSGPTLLAVAVVVLAVTACARDAGGAPAGSDRPARSDVPAEPVPSSSVPAMDGEVPVTILAAILQDATERSGVGLDDLVVSRAEAVTYSDGSLDCPEPGMTYTQALVDGYHVEIDADGATLDYRVGAGGSFRLCESGGPPGS